LPWIFIVQSLDMCTSLFVTNGNVLKSFRLNPMVLLTAQMMDNLINFLAAFLIIFTGLLFNLGGQTHLYGLWYTPLAVLVLLTGVSGLCWLLATTQIFLRDTRFVIQFATSVLFFLTPIFYPKELVPPQLSWFATINPFYRLIEPFRISVYDYHPDTFRISLAKGAATSALLMGAAAVLWYRKRRALYVYL
jgi:ABC-type polysaccharide/polyol phosphate export permease